MLNLKKAVMGIELGSTRIKAVILDERHVPIASGSHQWENALVDGVWTYSLEDVCSGLRDSFADLKRDLAERTGARLTTLGAIGVSAMMHGYLPFDGDMRQLTEFRTWRNTMTGPAAEELTELFGFNIPQRWSIAHLYEAILRGEEHLPRLDRLMTLAVYVHFMLTGRFAAGVGEASGMFPIGADGRDYDAAMVEKFEGLIAPRGYPWRLRDVLPQVLPAGETAGTLTKEGALFLDPTGELLPGIPVAPCEGDAGTGMAATNSVRVGTGNVSAGTSDFAMVVVDRPLVVHREIDMVTTPSGAPVAMVHCNNCTSDINAWVGLLAEFAGTLGVKVEREELFTRLFNVALEGRADCGGLLAFNYLSGEGVTGLDGGRPLFVRTPEAEFTLANFMRAHLYSALATLKAGLDILRVREGVEISRLCAHGGFFKTPGVGQRVLSAAAGVPVSVMETAGEGGPYGMALLASYMLRRAPGEALEDYLDSKVFAGAKSYTIMASGEDIAGFDAYLRRFLRALPVERSAVENV